MDVVIRRGPQWSDDLSTAAVEDWTELIGEYRAFCRRNLPNDCRNLLRMIAEGEQVEWAGYADRERYIRDGLGLDLRAVDWALRGLEITGLDAPVPFQQAQTLGKRGRPTKEEAGKGYNVTVSQRGNGRAYREAKAVRDGKPASYYREKPLTVLRRAWKRASDEERQAFRLETGAS